MNGHIGRCGRCNEPELLEECDAPLQLFLAAQTQWKRNARGWRTGFDYNGIEAIARLRGQMLDPEQFELLQVMEREIISIDSKQSDDNTD